MADRFHIEQLIRVAAPPVVVEQATDRITSLVVSR